MKIFKKCNKLMFNNSCGSKIQQISLQINIFITKYLTSKIYSNCRYKLPVSKGNRTIADLRYGGKDIISLSTLNFALMKG